MSAKEHSCCAHDHGHAHTHTPPAAPAPAPAGASTTRYRIVNMDCPVEERLIRNKVGAMAGIARLDFDLMSRILTVHHQLPDTAGIDAALRSIDMDGELLGAEIRALLDADGWRATATHRDLTTRDRTTTALRP